MRDFNFYVIFLKEARNVINFTPVYNQDHLLN